jgi:hypothetical protein
MFLNTSKPTHLWQPKICTQGSKKRTLNVEDEKKKKVVTMEQHTLLSSNWNPQRAALKRQTYLIFQRKNEGIGNAV